MSVINLGSFSATVSSALCPPPLVTGLLGRFVCLRLFYIVSLSGFSVQTPIATHFSLCVSVSVISVDLSSASLKRNVLFFC